LGVSNRLPLVEECGVLKKGGGGPGRNARATVLGPRVVDGRFDLPAAGV
jgi:hypothetical protein